MHYNKILLFYTRNKNCMPRYKSFISKSSTDNKQMYLQSIWAAIINRVKTSFTGAILLFMQVNSGCKLYLGDLNTNRSCHSILILLRNRRMVGDKELWRNNSSWIQIIGVLASVATIVQINESKRIFYRKQETFSNKLTTKILGVVYM